MRVRRHRRRRATAIVLGTGGLVLMTSCATFGGNVRGSFSCSAPNGSCAPSAAIDDRALAAIGGGEGGDFIPVSAETRPGGTELNSSNRASFARPVPPYPARTHERVLRIVFQPYIDERGRLHEATAVHAVVQSGDWQEAFSQRNVSAVTGLVSLADAVDRADPPRPAAADVLPPPEAVAAARARKANVGTTTKTDAPDRLAPGAMRAPVSAAPPTSPAPRGVSAGRGPHSAAVTAGPAQAKPDAAADAEPAVGLRTVMDALGRGAGTAASLPTEKGAATLPVIRAPGFPAHVAKDD